MDKASFFLAKAGRLKSREGPSADQDGAESRSRDGSVSPTTSTELIQEDNPLTESQMWGIMAEFMATMQANITSQLHALSTDLRKEIQD
ncbi:Hypothetical predicted protein, partial [Pelobates cultripes]